MSTILVDCDGVLASFTDAYLDLVYDVTGKRIDPNEVTNFKINRSPFFVELEKTFPRLRQTIDRIITTDRHFVYSLALIDGAQDGLELLREAGHRVVCVTSPWAGSEFWHHERHDWLEDVMGFDTHNIIFASDKSLVHGDYLIDDKVENLAEWSRCDARRKPILFDAPYNRDSKFPRAHTWEDVVRLCG